MVTSLVLTARVNINKTSHLFVKGFSLYIGWMESEQILTFLHESEESSAKTKMKRPQKNQIIYFFKLILMEIHILRVGFELRYQTEKVNLLPIWLTINIYAAICFDLIILPMYCCAGCLASNCNINILCKFKSLTAMSLRSRTQLGEYI